MSNGWKIFWLITAAIVVPGGIYAGIGVWMLTKLCYQMAGFKIKSFDAKYLYMDVSIRLSNPSELAVTASGYDLNFYLDDVLVANIKSTVPKEIASKDSSVLTLPLKIDYAHVFGAVKSKVLIGNLIAQKYDAITLKVDGTFSVKLLKIPYTHTLKQADWTWTLADILKIMAEPAAPPCK